MSPTPDPPVITIARDNVLRYAVWLELDGIKECRFWSSDYYTAVAYAQGIAAGIETVTALRCSQAFPITLEDFLAPRGDSPSPLVLPAGSTATLRQGGASTFRRFPADPAQPAADNTKRVEWNNGWAVTGRGDHTLSSPGSACRGFLLCPGQARETPVPDPLDLEAMLT